MKFFTSFALLTLATTISAEEEIQVAYHENVGIPEASRIKDVEEQTSPVQTRIVGGLGSFMGEHPFFGGLIITLTDGQISVCGSSLISNWRIVTAAHCYYDGYYQAYSMLVVLGSVRLFSGGTRVSATSIVVHPSFNPVTVQNDVAVLNIPYVASTSYVKPIALPAGFQLTNDFVGYRAEAIGFGKTSDSDTITTSVSLRDVFVDVISNAGCQVAYGGLVTTSHMCTSGAGGRNPCGGDSGGPLILYSSTGDDLLIGIITYGSSSGCAAGLPTVHTRVTSHAAWIRSQL
ncbi:hypothetical protein K1T71_002083 [Dendrolimus kikuchii]|uniref:Uncharacterized protein n=1 Tax=Dendrolimus kikuchii TaxID=765133 RepID=A0ACC1DFI2_9NEOP|nr:hypothetical protein K1T71_002083 [Dendrolimus kikuchii]